MMFIIKLYFDDILFKYSNHNFYQEILKPHFGNPSSYIEVTFYKENNLSYPINIEILGSNYSKLFDFLDEKNDFYNITHEIDNNKKNFAFFKCYDNDFDIYKIIPKDVLDLLPLYDIKINFLNKYDTNKPEILNIIKKFENFRNDSFYKKNTFLQNKKLKKQN